MTHWGWYWKVKKKHVPRKLCSKLPQIDSFRFYKGTQKHNIITGFIVDPLEVKAEAYPDHLKVTYRNRKEHSYTIAVDKLPCNYGGNRYFFKCPLCQKRMRFLYFAEQSIFLCRKCLNLSYQSQRLRPTNRYEHMSDKIKAAIKTKGGDLDLFKKPPRMHKGKYENLRSKQFYYECKSPQALNRELRLWHGAKVEPYLDKFFDYVDEGKA
jgi:hypothetical protein